MGKITAGASYMAPLFIMATLGGALKIQLTNIATGRDLQDMKDVRFWMAAMATGGGMGIFGDFLFGDMTRAGHTFGKTIAGPTGGFIGDLLQFTLGNWAQLAQGKPTDIGREVVDLFARYTPIIGSGWYTRVAYRRELLDQLQYQLDPRAHRRWTEERRRSVRERGQDFWWPPGQLTPTRPPRLLQ
jgi:hypothetical protein